MRKTKKPLRPWRSLFAGALCVTLSIVVGFKIAIRSIGISDSQVALQDARDLQANQVSRGEALARQRVLDVQYRDEALAWDREFLQSRQHRRWLDETADRPDHREARHTWQREVDEIQKQIAEAESLQEALGENGPLSEGTVLWHRKEHLKKLQQDAPPPY